MNVSAVVAWFDDQKGFGFAIARDGRKLFVHRNNFAAGQREEAIRSLIQGSKIECEIREDNDFTDALNSGCLRDVRMNIPLTGFVNLHYNRINNQERLPD